MRLKPLEKILETRWCVRSIGQTAAGPVYYFVLFKKIFLGLFMENLKQMKSKYNRILNQCLGQRLSSGNVQNSEGWRMRR